MEKKAIGLLLFVTVGLLKCGEHRTETAVRTRATCAVTEGKDTSLSYAIVATTTEEEWTARERKA